MKITYFEALKDAIVDELKKNRSLVYISEDLDMFDIDNSNNLEYQYFSDRIINVPALENAYVGMATGLAMSGNDVIVKIPSVTSLIKSLDSILNYANNIAKQDENLFAGGLLIRCPVGNDLISPSPDNSLIESIVCGYDGVKVFFPYDANDLSKIIKSALKEKCPTILFEEKSLYEREYNVEKTNLGGLESAKILKEGSDISVISYGAPLSLILNVSNNLLKENIDVEVVDIKSLYPIDKKTIINSVKKTGRALILSDLSKAFGISSEISALITESDAFDYLKAPVTRLCVKEKLSTLNNDFYEDDFVSEEDILSKIKDTLFY